MFNAIICQREFGVQCKLNQVKQLKFVNDKIGSDVFFSLVRKYSSFMFVIGQEKTLYVNG